MLVLKILCSVLFCAGIAHSYNILAIFPHMGLSHWAFFRPFVLELVNRGHNVTLLSYFGIEELKDRGNYDEFLFKRDQVLTNTFAIEDYTPNFYRDLHRSIRELSKWGEGACDLLLNNEKTNDILGQNHSFDLLLTEIFHTDCAAGLAYQLNNIPIVGLSSCVLMPYHYARFGLPDSPSFIPSEYVGFSEQMTLLQRTANFLITKSMQILHIFYQSVPDNQMLRKKFGESFPDVRLLARNMSLALVNQHFSIGGARPSPPNVLDMAGVHVTGQKKQELSSELIELLDSSEKGVIVMSFGSIVKLSSLPLEKRRILWNVFRKLDQQILMKWETDSEIIEDKPKNVHFLKWLPQREILAHRNVRVFFSHGGMLGVIEALANSVPVIGTPIYGDQYLNVAVVDHRKAGVLLNYVEWSEDSLLEAIQKALSEEYQNNAEMISFYLNHPTRDPLNNGVTAIENVVATNGFRLAQPYAIQLSWIEYHSIDAILLILAPFLILGLLLAKLTTGSKRGVEKSKLQ